jgi:hypothetical protein
MIVATKAGRSMGTRQVQGVVPAAGGRVGTRSVAHCKPAPGLQGWWSHRRSSYGRPSCWSPAASRRCAVLACVDLSPQPTPPRPNVPSSRGHLVPAAPAAARSTCSVLKTHHYKRIHTFSPSIAHAHAHINTPTHTHHLTPWCARTRTHTHTHTLTHTHTHTHTQRSWWSSAAAWSPASTAATSYS